MNFTYTHINSHTHKHTRINTQTHTHTHTHIHIQTNTHTFLIFHPLNKWKLIYSLQGNAIKHDILKPRFDLLKFS